MKKLFSLIFSLLFLSTNISYAISYDDINTIKDPSYRVGATDNIENKVEIETRIQMQSAKMHTKVENSENLTYADLSIKKISSEIAQDLDMDYDTMLADLSVLWQGAATQSDTIKYALYKLSNPNADKPDQHSIKKVLSDRKSTRLNSSHQINSYAVFCLKKKKDKTEAGEERPKDKHREEWSFIGCYC